MGLNETPSANRLHIAFFGRRNTGKSSLVNAVLGQNLAVVSDIKGTTTDPVYKAMELLPLGPVVIIDTPGIDDEGALGEQRIQKTRQVLNKTDIAVLVLDGESSPAGKLFADEEKMIGFFNDKKIPFITILNKSDLVNKCSPNELTHGNNDSSECLPVSAKTGFNINLFKEKIISLVPPEEKTPLVFDLINPGDFVLLVVPIDSAAPKGRLILPVQQVLREILERGGSAIIVKDSELPDTLAFLGKKPALVITDSKVFAEVAKIVPREIKLTSFSILFARKKGWLDTAVRGISALDTLKNTDKILVCEGCTHHRQCDDIGRVKIPGFIKNYHKKDFEFTFCSGGDFPDDLSGFKLIIHCGACLLNDREMLYRRRRAEEQDIAFTNYGIVITFIQGFLKRSIEIFKS